MMVKLYAVKIGDNYLRKKDEDILLVSLAKASVFGSLEDAAALKNLYGSGRIAELTLTEKLL